jgi:hypothetical protein
MIALVVASASAPHSRGVLHEDNKLQASALDGTIGCGHVYLGWSTGHVGTTTASDASSYLYSAAHPNTTYKFIFEAGKMESAVWDKGVTISEQMAHVQKEYLPHWQATSRLSDKCVDLSHVNLLFIDGLIQDLLDRHKQITLLRIRRPYYETALSLVHTYKPKIERDALGCDTNGVGRMCPIAVGDSGKRVQLVVPTDTWHGWSLLQRMLWQIDEVEAQWHRLKSQYGRRLSFAETAWSEKEDDFASKAMVDIANVLGLKAKPQPEDEKGHLNENERHDLMPLDQAQEVRQYVQDMVASSPAFKLRDGCLPDTQHGAVLVPPECTSLFTDRLEISGRAGRSAR